MNRYIIISRNIFVLYPVLLIHRTHLILQIYFGEPQVVRLLLLLYFFSVLALADY